MYRKGERHREFGVRSGPFTGGRIAIATHDLPQGVRQKLSASLLRYADPRPVASDAPSRPPRLAMLALGVASLAVLLFVANTGFGDASGARSTLGAFQSRIFLLAYAPALVCLALSIRAFARSFAIEGWPSLPLGRHVLPLDLVEIRQGELIIRPFGDARDVRVSEDERTITIAYADNTVETITPHPEPGSSLFVRMLDAQHALEEATLACSKAQDPLAELRGPDGFLEPWSKMRTPRVTAAPRKLERVAPWLLAAVAALASVPLLAWRNAASDDVMFAQAERSGLRAHFQEYLSAGGRRHADLVRKELLPRAILSEARTSTNELAVLRELRGDFVGSNVEAEATSRFNAACRTALDRAQTFEALRSFQETSPDCHDDDEIAAANVHLHDALLAKAKAVGVGAIRDYVRHYPDSPIRDRATRALADELESDRERVRSLVRRRELRDAFIALIDRSQREGLPPMLLISLDLPFTEPTLTRTREALDRAIDKLIGTGVAFVYHPVTVGADDAKRSTVLRVEVKLGSELTTFVANYELASLGVTTRFTASIDERRLSGDALLYAAISSSAH